MQILCSNSPKNCYHANNISITYKQEAQLLQRNSASAAHTEGG